MKYMALKGPLVGQAMSAKVWETTLPQTGTQKPGGPKAITSKTCAQFSRAERG